jgi:hypothetical protein
LHLEAIYIHFRPFASPLSLHYTLGPLFPLFSLLSLCSLLSPLSLLSALCLSATTTTTTTATATTTATMPTMTTRRRSQVHPNSLAALCDGVDTILEEQPPRPSGSELRARRRTLFGVQLSTPPSPEFNQFRDLYNADGTCMTFRSLHDVSCHR